MDNILKRSRGGPGGDPRKLIERFGAQMLATARRYSAGSDDAEDAYQRAAEIVVKHRPTGSDDELLRWLRTTVKREALAIRRYRSRVVAFGEPEYLPEPGGGGRPAHAADAYEVAERLERLSLGAEALRRLKPQEIRALQLKAEGYSYAEICEITGWTYTKVNRCLTEGRQAFRQHVELIESGSECARLAPALASLAGGARAIEGEAQVRAHLRTCLTCRARLREHRARPSELVAVGPVAAVASALQERWAGVAGAVHDRLATIGERLQQAGELATAQKATAVVVASAALAGGGSATVDRLVDGPSKQAAMQARGLPAPADVAPPPPTAVPPPAAAPGPSDPSPRPAGESSPPIRPEPPAPTEFGPEAQAPSGGNPIPEPVPPSRTDPGQFER